MKKGFRVSPDCVRCSVVMLRFRNAGRLCLDAFKLKFVTSWCFLFSQWRKLWKKRWVALHGAEVVYMDAEPTVENSATMTITKAEVRAHVV
jgi:hypothetical protein